MRFNNYGMLIRVLLFCTFSVFFLLCPFGTAELSASQSRRFKRGDNTSYGDHKRNIDEFNNADANSSSSASSKVIDVERAKKAKHAHGRQDQGPNSIERRYDGNGISVKPQQTAGSAHQGHGLFPTSTAEHTVANEQQHTFDDDEMTENNPTPAATDNANKPRYALHRENINKAFWTVQNVLPMNLWERIQKKRKDAFRLVTLKAACIYINWLRGILNQWKVQEEEAQKMLQIYIDQIHAIKIKANNNILLPPGFHWPAMHFSPKLELMKYTKERVFDLTPILNEVPIPKLQIPETKLLIEHVFQRYEEYIKQLLVHGASYGLLDLANVNVEKLLKTFHNKKFPMEPDYFMMPRGAVNPFADPVIIAKLGNNWLLQEWSSRAKHNWWNLHQQKQMISFSANQQANHGAIAAGYQQNHQTAGDYHYAAGKSDGILETMDADAPTIKSKWEQQLKQAQKRPPTAPQMLAKAGTSSAGNTHFPFAHIAHEELYPEQQQQPEGSQKQMGSSSNNHNIPLQIGQQAQMDNIFEEERMNRQAAPVPQDDGWNFPENTEHLGQYFDDGFYYDDMLYKDDAFYQDPMTLRNNWDFPTQAFVGTKEHVSDVPHPLASVHPVVSQNSSQQQQQQNIDKGKAKNVVVDNSP